MGFLSGSRENHDGIEHDDDHRHRSLVVFMLSRVSTLEYLANVVCPDAALGHILTVVPLGMNHVSPPVLL